MNRFEAIQRIIRNLQGKELIVHANGAMGRESLACADRKENFYLIGSMGLAAAVGLGVAISRPERDVIIMDGDGNLLMGMGNMALIGALKPKNITHCLLDNGVYGTTGNQPTLSPYLDLTAVAQACGYRQVTDVRTSADLDRVMQKRRSNPGPFFIRIHISTETGPACLRIPYTARQLAERFRGAIA